MSTKTEELAVTSSKQYIGFWMYLMADCILFAALFATYAVLRGNTFGGPAGVEIFNLDFILIETLLLLTSSFTCGLAVVSAKANIRRYVLAALGMTFVLGASFLMMEVSEFAKLIAEGHSWTESAFLSAFFTIVGTHGLHILVGLMWLSVLAVSIWRRGLTKTTIRRITLFSLYWHFLDVIWIFIFTIVYLFGALAV